MYSKPIERAISKLAHRQLIASQTQLLHTSSNVLQEVGSNLNSAYTAYNYNSKQEQQPRDSNNLGGKSDSLQFIKADSVSSNVRPGGRQSVSGIIASVFGATGFIGRYVVNNLGRIGSQVVTPYRGDGFNTRHLRLAGDLGQIIPIPYNFNDIDSVKRSMSRSNVVVNLIGSHHDTANYSIDDANVKLTYRLATTAKELGVERFIHISHINAHHNSSSALYRAKAEAEQIVREYYPDATILRCSTVFGAEDKFINRYAAMGSNLIRVPVLANNDKIYQPVFVGDVARAVMNAIVYGESVGKTYVLAGDTAFTEKQLLDLISRYTYFDIRSIDVPEFLLRIYANVLSGKRFNNFVLKHFRAPTWYHPDLVEQQKYNEVVPNNVLTLRDLGIEPTPLLTQIKPLLISYARNKGPDRFQNLDVKPSTAISLLGSLENQSNISIRMNIKKKREHNK